MQQSASRPPVVGALPAGSNWLPGDRYHLADHLASFSPGQTEAFTHAQCIVEGRHAPSCSHDEGQFGRLISMR